jgi:hypothetical protein
VRPGGPRWPARSPLTGQAILGRDQGAIGS